MLHRSAQTGILAQARGNAACVAWSSMKPCLSMGTSDEYGGYNVQALAVAPDGHDLYVASQYTDYSGGKEEERSRFDVLRRAPNSGELHRSMGPDGCFISWDPKYSNAKGCTRAWALDLPNAVEVSPDGRHVYVGSFGGVSVFRRSDAGQLQLLAGRSGCLLAEPGPQSWGKPDRCSDRPKGRTGGTLALAVSHDGKSLYALIEGKVNKVHSGGPSLVLAFARDARTGVLTRVPGPTGCLSGVPRSGCRLVKGLAGYPWDDQVLAISRDGRNLYFANHVRIVTLARSADGSLVPRLGVTPLRRRGTYATDMVVTPDGRSLYLAANDALMTYARNARTGNLSSPQCLTQARKPGCLQARSMGEKVIAVTVTPDGKHVYVVGISETGGAHITAYSRRATP